MSHSFNTFPEDNGFSFRSHAFGLFIATVSSIVIHLLILYFCAAIPIDTMGQSEQVEQEKPPTYPLLQLKQLFADPIARKLLVAKASQAPDIVQEIAKSDQLLDSSAQAAAREPAPPQNPNHLDYTAMAPVPPSGFPVSPNSQWMPRQEIAAVPRITTPKDRHTPWTIDTLPHVKNAADITLPVHLKKMPDSVAMSSHSGGASAWNAASSTTSPVNTRAIGVDDDLREGLPEWDSADALVKDATSQDALEESLKELTPPAENKTLFQPLDNRLRLSLYTWQDIKEPNMLYYRLNIARRPDSELAILPKDVIFVQDVSRSINTRRLRYCRQALQTALSTTLRADDRFMVVAFHNTMAKSSSTLAPVNSGTIAYAHRFIDSLQARGSTDLYRMLSEVLAVPSDPQRPLIIVVVTDGEATKGVTETTRIIGEFTRKNRGRISVYTFSTRHNDSYFLDMLAYCNRGEATIVQGSRWEIPTELAPVFTGIRNPVLKDLSFTFDSTSGSQIHPNYLTNLYADKPINLYGRCPIDTRQVVCQIRGKAGANPYDAVFKFDLTTQVNPSRDNLRETWAERCMFDYLAEYARNPSPELLSRMDRVSAEFGVRNPYRR